jgi:hypothetical protein
MRLSRMIVGPVVVLAFVLFLLATAGGWGLKDSSPNGSLGEQVLRGLTPLERAILADKKVSPAEYMLAVQDTVGCLRTAGFAVTDPVKAENGTLQYSASYSPPEMATAGPDAPPPDTSKMDAKNAACEQRSAAAGAVFVLQHATSWTVRPLPGLEEALARYKG